MTANADIVPVVANGQVYVASEQQSLARGGTLLVPGILNEGRHKARSAVLDAIRFTLDGKPRTA